MSTPRHTTKLTETETPETSFDDDDVGGGDDDDDNVRDEKHKHPPHYGGALSFAH